MKIPKDLKKIIKERKKLESDLNLTHTIYETLKLIEDEYRRAGNYSSYRRSDEATSWRYKTIKVEDFECYSKDLLKCCRYNFEHNKNDYSTIMESNLSYSLISVLKSKNYAVFEATINHEKLFRQIEITGFLPEGEWYNTLLQNFEAFTKEAYTIIRAENKKMCDKIEQKHIKDMRKSFMGK